MTLTQIEQNALEAAILAYATAQAERLARSAAALKEEAQLPRGATVQTACGGTVLQDAWFDYDETKLEAAVLEYLTAQGGRLARTAAALPIVKSFSLCASPCAGKKQQVLAAGCSKRNHARELDHNETRTVHRQPYPHRGLELHPNLPLNSP